MISKLGEQQMDVIRHHDPSVQQDAFAIEVAERVGDDAGVLWILEHTGAVSTIEPALEAFGKPVMILALDLLRPRTWRMRSQPFALLEGEFGQRPGGHRVVEPERGEIGCPGLFKMGYAVLGSM